MKIRSCFESGRNAIRSFTPAIAALVLAVMLIPAQAGAQSDIMVTYFTVTSPYGTPGGDIYVDFTIQNVGPAPTAVSAILNYIFVWDTFNNITLTQLLPDATGHAHTLRSLLPGESDVFTGVQLTIPADQPMDTTITLALFTDYPDLEPEMDELNNFAITVVSIEPQIVNFTETQTSVMGNIDLPYYSDLFRFPGQTGEIVYSEGIAAELGSILDPMVLLLGPHPDSLLTPEGDITAIYPDSRLTNLGLPSDSEYRLEMYGEAGSVGMYELRLQRGIPEMEPNDHPVDAQPINYGEAHAGAFDYPGDADWYFFNAGAGDIVVIDIDASQAFVPLPDSTLDPIGVIVDAAWDTLEIDDDTDDMDPYLFFITPQAGAYFLGLESAPGGGLGGGYPGCFYAFKIRQITGVMKPDLTPMNITPITVPVPACDTAHVYFETWNIGGLATFEEGATIDVLLSTDAVIDPSDRLIEVGDFVGDVDPGTYHPTYIDVRIPWDVPPGGYYLGIVLDSTEDEVEEDETNNTAVLPITVDPYTGTEDPGLFPDEIALFRSYPNPSTGRSVISYELPARAAGDPGSWKVEISVYNVAGQRVAKLVDDTMPAGRHQVVWDGRANGRRLPSGVYFCRMKAGGVERSFRIVLLR